MPRPGLAVLRKVDSEALRRLAEKYDFDYGEIEAVVRRRGGRKSSSGGGKVTIEAFMRLREKYLQYKTGAMSAREWAAAVGEILGWWDPRRLRGGKKPALAPPPARQMKVKTGRRTALVDLDALWREARRAWEERDAAALRRIAKKCGELAEKAEPPLQYDLEARARYLARRAEEIEALGV